jgi:hypothetical protein
MILVTLALTWPWPWVGAWVWSWTWNIDILVAVIGSVGLILAALITGLFSLAVIKISKIQLKVDAIHLDVNSRVTQLIETTRQLYESIGAKKERDRAERYKNGSEESS